MHKIISQLNRYLHMEPKFMTVKTLYSKHVTVPVFLGLDAHWFFLARQILFALWSRQCLNQCIGKQEPIASTLLQQSICTGVAHKWVKA